MSRRILRVGICLILTLAISVTWASDIQTDGRFISTWPGPDAPFEVASSEVVVNLNADLLDGFDSTFFAPSGHLHDGTYAPVVHEHAGEDITSGTIPESVLDPKLVRDDEIMNPMRIALERWYGAIETGYGIAVGNAPRGLAFDGTHMWVANDSIDMVTKVRASDGFVVGAFGVGDRPSGLAFDGAHIWVANSTDNTVSKLLASDGSDLGTFSVGLSPFEMAFDGTHIWVGNYDDETVSKLLAVDGTVVDTISVGNTPSALAFDSDHIWVANRNDGTVNKI